ncbi:MULTISPECIES: mannose/fructose/sorbose PTS transporter subunit IIA [Clostridium]|uniref:PTS system mannose-specific EIIAB component n=1 Tax=Clostridium acetobutylicum (strain ATCC 824 / DSM 792 / JCM 1419 / IAM 19013 / LMG 5710 / NBRC 13948 / NRRL B-527 / VKM B-1787 / 2291 / W) TaxID=272562 RepID=Q97TN2_CLOAB|nr:MULTISPECIES: mannose/fructose/sorbose PTS transporter subunit IIA [Clostridium]AAK76812.1 Mannose-specific phosphotransferase system component IIAB [Clostridium acetobutylicum ATCC 824]ADZ22848.1 Mannose-specific phosphotransferase system component IIAB [Clostridium acetobutylicum EA 2018]AEI34808.1 mannose-specific phosphotransferase system component IIAB [Clostridium acetobutylicum DSM 1731]AWV82357.1 PTS mannose transporter subunit IIAB [Clostridium acetobutylicum]MBC2395800.1 PTS manno
MVGIILASHGEFAKGILQSGAMIFGDQENVQAVTLMPSEGPDDVKAKMKDAIASFDNQDEVLFLVDLWGGTPFNQANSLFEEHKDKWAIVAGMNLPMVIEAYGARLSMESAHEIAASIISTAKEGVKVKPEELEPEDAGKASQGSAKQSNTGAPGSFEYVLARIDSRLLHGQVATAWTKAMQPTRIIVVSDAVAKDELRKKLIQQAAPPGVKAHVVPINHMIKLAKDDQHFGGQRAMLLFENPEDVLRVVEGGVPLKTINVGSMAHSTGKVQPNKVLAFNQEDIDTFNKLKQSGLTFDVRKVPNDSKGNMDEIIKKAQDELNKQK